MTVSNHARAALERSMHSIPDAAEVYSYQPAAVTQTISIADFTDGTGTSGYLDLSTQVPAGSLVLGWKFIATTGFSGDTTAVMTVGISGATTSFSADTTNSVVEAGTVVSAAVVATAACDSATTVRVTVTGGSDFGKITAGAGRIIVWYIQN